LHFIKTTPRRNDDLTEYSAVRSIFTAGAEGEGEMDEPIFQERTETGIPLVFVGIARLHDYRLSLPATLGLKAKKS